MSRISKLLVIALFACKKGPDGEPIHSVKEYVLDQALLEKTKNWCGSSPGDRMATPNCINSVEAYRLIHMCHEFSTGDKATKACIADIVTKHHLE